MECVESARTMQKSQLLKLRSALEFTKSVKVVFVFNSIWCQHFSSRTFVSAPRLWTEKCYASRPSQFRAHVRKWCQTTFYRPLLNLWSQIHKLKMMCAWNFENMFPINFDYLYSVDDVWVGALEKMNRYSSLIYRKSESNGGMGRCRGVVADSMQTTPVDEEKSNFLDFYRFSSADSPLAQFS